MEYYTGIILD